MRSKVWLSVKISCLLDVSIAINKLKTREKVRRYDPTVYQFIEDFLENSQDINKRETKETRSRVFALFFHEEQFPFFHFSAEISARESRQSGLYNIYL